MKRTYSIIPSLIAGALVFGSLGISGFVGAVATMADDREPITAADHLAEADVTALPQTTQNFVVRASRSTRDSDLDANRQRLSVRLGKDGTISGRLNISDSVTGAHVVAEKMNVKFVQRGSIVTEAKPGPGGVFRLSGVNPGVFSMIAEGPDGFFACAVLVAPFAGDSEVGAVDSLQIDASVVSPINVAAAKKLVLGRSVISEKQRAGVAKKNGSQVITASSRHSVDSEAPLHTPVLAKDPSGKVSVRINELDPATTDRHPASGATVYMIQGGSIRGRYTVNQDGSFHAPALSSGQYSMVALGQGSKTFAAIGVIVEDATAASSTVNNGGRMTVQQAKATRRQGGSDVDMIPSDDFGSTADPDSNNRRQDEPMGGGGFGGTTGGFGGAGGGGLGGLGLIGAGLGAAGLAAALANRNNGNANSPTK